MQSGSETENRPAVQPRSQGSVVPACPRATFAVRSTHPMNSARLLLELTSMPRRDAQSQGWDSLIHRGSMRRLMLTLQYREPAIVQHSRRVATLAQGIAESLGWDGRNLQILEASCLLHDVGKIAIPDLILNKPGKLSPDESDLVGLLYRINGDVLQACGADQEVVEIVTQAQYHYNGAGQSFNVIGSDVHQGARILAVVDAYDSLTSPQVFRSAHTHSEAMELLTRSAGSQYDGNVISALQRWFESNGLPAELNAIQNYQLQPEEIIEAGSLSHVFSYLYLLESLYHGFYLVGPDCRPLVWSDGCQELTGYTWQHVLGYTNEMFAVHYRNSYGEQLKPQEYPIYKAAETGHGQASELQIQRSDGEWLPVEVQTLPLIDSAGRLQGFAEILRDQSGHREKGQYRDLKLMASRDALTHVANRGELKRQLDRHMKAWRDQGVPFSVIFLDVDHFKRANDTWGHAAGDEVLISVARLLQHETYSGEFIARYGGEEFVVLCPETELNDALARADRLRSALQNAQVVKTDEFRVTASFGVAQAEAEDSPDDVLQRADKALYMAKRQGRNRCNKLTTQMIRENDPSMIDPPEQAPDQYEYTNVLRACIDADMIVFKLRAFVEDQQAKLGEVSKERVTMKLGQRGLIPFWGQTPDRQPVKITLVLGGNERSAVQRGASKVIDIKVQIEPVGWPKSGDVFQTRCRAVMKELRESFAAEPEKE